MSLSLFKTPSGTDLDGDVSTMVEVTQEARRAAAAPRGSSFSPGMPHALGPSPIVGSWKANMRLKLDQVGSLRRCSETFCVGKILLSGLERQ